MAEDAVDEAIEVFGLKPQPVALPDISGAGLPGFTTTGECRTRKTPVAGAHGYSPALPAQLMETHAVDSDVAFHLATNYGDRAWSVLADASASASTARLAAPFPFIEAEVRHAIRAEAACTAADVISRRMRLAFLDVDKALSALPRIIDVMADELGWSAPRQEHEWTATVRFLRSMGLAEERLAVTRDEVLNGSAPTARDGAEAARAGRAKEREAAGDGALASEA